MQTFDMNEILQSQLCVMSGFSSNHFQQGLNLVLTTQQFHPCLKMYIHDLGLMPHEKAFLSSFPFITMREFKMNQELFPGGACAFKPPLILNFMKAYGAEHKCRFVLYGDASIMMHAKLDADLIEEVLRNGIATDSPVKYWQISFTHPAMYEYFGFNRESDFRTSDKGRMKQTQAGLMMFDSLNYTLRDTFFNEWAECATNPACLTPDNIITNKLPPNAPSELYPLRDGTKVFRFVYYCKFKSATTNMWRLQGT